MKKILSMLFIAFIAIAPLSAADADEEYQQVTQKFQDSKSSSDFFKTCYGYAIFPSVGKGGFGIGGAYGSGRVYIGKKLVANTSVSQITFGFQFGGQAYSQIMFFKDANAFSTFKTGNFELGAQASAVAITAGVAVNADYDKGIAIFTMAKGGLMYEASVGGQKFDYSAIK